jgi:hypothetical protein
MNTIDINITHTSENEPKLTAVRYGRSTKYYIPYNINKIDDVYEFKYVLVTPESYNYGGMVDAIIYTKYDSKDVIAILINFVGDPTNEVYKAEFDELQEWRKFAKSEARKHFNIQ